MVLRRCNLEILLVDWMASSSSNMSVDIDPCEGTDPRPGSDACPSSGASRFGLLEELVRLMIPWSDVLLLQLSASGWSSAKKLS